MAFFLPSAVLFFFAIVIQDLILGIVSFFGIVFGIANAYVALEEQEEHGYEERLEKKRLMREIEELKTEVKKPMRKTPAKKTAALKAPVKARRGKKKR